MVRKCNLESLETGKKRRLVENNHFDPSVDGATFLGLIFCDWL